MCNLVIELCTFGLVLTVTNSENWILQPQSEAVNVPQDVFALHISNLIGNLLV